MNKKIFLIILICALITVVPTASAQLSMGVEANQKSIEVIVDKSEIVQVKHVIYSSNMPVNVNLFNGVMNESIVVTNEEGENKDIGIMNDGKGNIVLTIFPSKQNSIIKYNLEDASTFYDNLWTVRIQYSETYSVLFSEEINLFFLNENVIQLKNKNGIAINYGGNALIQYYDKIPKIIEEVRWEEDKFNVEIITNSKIDKFDFDQASKSISFQVNEKNKFITINMEKELLGGPYVILLNDERITYSKYFTKENHISLSMKPESTGKIIIIGTTVIPEFSMFIPLVFGFMIILTLPLMRKISLH